MTAGHAATAPDVREDDATKVTLPRSRRLRTVVAACLALGVLGAAAGCGGSTDSPQAPAGAAAQGATADAGIVSDSKRIVDAARTGLVSGSAYGFVNPGEITQVQSFPSPPPIAHKAGDKGHRVAIVACEEQGLCGRLAAVQEGVFKRMGWDASVTTAVFSAGVSADQAFQRAWNAAAAKKPDVILALAVSGIFVQQQLKQAKADGITTIDVFQGPESGRGYAVYLPASYNLQREIQAAYSIAATGGRAKNLILDLQGFPNLATPDQSQYLGLCKICKTDDTPVQITDNIDPVKAQALSSSLTRRNEYNFVSLSTGGGANAGYEQGLRASGSHAKYLSVDAIPQNVDLLHGGTFAAVSWVPADWVALAGVDATLRAVSGAKQPALNAWRFGIGLWEPGNAPPKGSSWLALTDAAVKRFDFLAPYAKAWGLNERDLRIAG
jgi:ABC-type sugar transport system substrate-binding protein